MNLQTLLYAFALLICVVFFSSCKTFQAPVTGARSVAYQPSVTLKTGETITGNAVRAKSKLFAKDKIQIDGNSYLAREVAFYQNDTGRFANVGSTEFAWQSVNGKIKAYMIKKHRTSNTYNSSTGTTRTSTKTIIKHYLQKGDTTPVVPFSLATMRNYVSPYQPSLELMQKSYRENHKQQILGATTIGLLAGGFLVTCVGGAKWVSSAGSKGGIMYTGLACMGVSIGTLFTFSLAKYKSKKYAWEAMEHYNNNN